MHDAVTFCNYYYSIDTTDVILATKFNVFLASFLVRNVDAIAAAMMFAKQRIVYVAKDLDL
jgi:hypothetical protein